MELSNLKLSILMGGFTTAMASQISFKKLDGRYGIGMQKIFLGKIVTYLICTVSGKLI